MNFYKDLQKAKVTISEPCNNEINAEFCFNEDAAVFTGHFPGMPIVPGVMQIEMTKFAVELAMKKEYRFKSVKKTKFTEEIKPGDKITIKITLTESGPDLNVKAILKTNDKPAGKNKLILIELKKQSSSTTL